MQLPDINIDWQPGPMHFLCCHILSLLRRHADDDPSEGPKIDNTVRFELIAAIVFAKLEREESLRIPLQMRIEPPGTVGRMFRSQTLETTLDQCVEAGWIERPGRGRYNYSLTSKGREMVERFRVEGLESVEGQALDSRAVGVAILAKVTAIVQEFARVHPVELRRALAKEAAEDIATGILNPYLEVDSTYANYVSGMQRSIAASGRIADGNNAAYVRFDG